MTEPAVSVVVATHQRAALLPRLVDAVAAQEGVGPVELVVVDDGSTDDTPAVLDRLAASSPIPLLPLRMEPNVGPAAARNAGWRTARAPVIAFTDDDCVPQPGWLAGLVAAIATADLVQGMTLPDPAQAGAMGPFARSLEVTGEAGFYETCNMAYRREVLERVGGFDERFRHPFGEDVDLAWRAKEAGARTAFAADALVHHDVAPSRLGDRVREARRLGGAALALRAHPQLRRFLTGRLLYRQGHAWALVSALGLLRARRWRGAVAALLPYAWYRLRVEPLPGPSPRRELAIPGALVLDLAEVAVLAAASARHRTLVL